MLLTCRLPLFKREFQVAHVLLTHEVVRVLLTREVAHVLLTHEVVRVLLAREMAHELLTYCPEL